MKRVSALLAIAMLLGCTSGNTEISEASKADVVLKVMPTMYNFDPFRVQSEIHLNGQDHGAMMWTTSEENAGLLRPDGREYRLERVTTPPALGLTVTIVQKFPCETCDPQQDPIIVLGVSHIYAVPPPVGGGNMRFRVTREAAALLAVGMEYLFVEG